MRGALLFSLLLLTVSTAQGAHITDQVLAGLYAEPSLEDGPLKALPSGTPLEVLEVQQAFTRVRLGDNTEGWVESRYITNKTPAKVQLLELQAKSTIQAQQLRQAEARLAQLEQAGALAAATDNRALAEARAEIARLKARLREADSTPTWRALVLTIANYPFELWHLALLGLSLLIGFIVGMRFKARRIAKRLGGLRV